MSSQDDRSGRPSASTGQARLLWVSRLRRFGGAEIGALHRAAGLLILFALLAQTVWDFSGVSLQHIEETAERALQAFAVARGINAVISVIQDVEIGFTFGLAATLSPGEILDPVNDLVERFSLVMLIASALLWTLRLVSGLLFEPALLWATLALYAASLFLLKGGRRWLRLSGDLGVRVSLLVLVAVAYGFLTPLAINLVHETEFISAEFSASAVGISGAQEKLEAMNLELDADIQAKESEGECKGVAQCIESLGESVAGLSGKIGEYSELGKRYQGYIDEATELADRVSRQVVVQIAVFALETLLIPLFGLWVAAMVVRRVFGR